MTEWVIDASVAIKWLVRNEPLRAKAKDLLQEIRKQRIEMISPPLLEYELESELQRRLISRQLNVSVVDEALKRFYSLQIKIVTDPQLVRRAREIARQCRQERIYDSLYAALAELRKGEFWTADKRFYDAAHSAFPFVQYLADFE